MKNQPRQTKNRVSDIEVLDNLTHIKSGFQIVRFALPNGYLKSTVTPQNTELTIVELEVEQGHHGKGIGRVLLERCRTEAKARRISIICGVLRSAESVQICSAVFGHDSLDVSTDGSFSPQGEDSLEDAWAWLNYDVPVDEVTKHLTD